MTSDYIHFNESKEVQYWNNIKENEVNKSKNDVLITILKGPEWYQHKVEEK